MNLQNIALKNAALQRMLSKCYVRLPTHTPSLTFIHESKKLVGREKIPHPSAQLNIKKGEGGIFVFSNRGGDIEGGLDYTVNLTNYD